MEPGKHKSVGSDALVAPFISREATKFSKCSIYGIDGRIHEKRGNKMEQSTMTFPEVEHSSISSRLNQGKLCYTTRVFKELGRYQEGVKYNTP